MIMTNRMIHKCTYVKGFNFYQNCMMMHHLSNFDKDWTNDIEDLEITCPHNDGNSLGIFIDENLKNRWTEIKLSGNRILDVPTATFVLETGFPANEKFKNRLYDMSVTCWLEDTAQNWSYLISWDISTTPSAFFV